MNKKQIGAEGETAACKYLVKAGYRIIERNHRDSAGEIDVIAKKDDVIVFVEVKTRNGSGYGYAAECVGAVQRRRYVASAKKYLAANNMCSKDARFDVIEVQDGRINHIIDAFRS